MDIQIKDSFNMWEIVEETNRRMNTARDSKQVMELLELSALACNVYLDDSEGKKFETRKRIVFGVGVSDGSAAGYCGCSLCRARAAGVLPSSSRNPAREHPAVQLVRQCRGWFVDARDIPEGKHIINILCRTHGADFYKADFIVTTSGACLKSRFPMGTHNNEIFEGKGEWKTISCPPAGNIYFWFNDD